MIKKAKKISKFRLACQEVRSYCDDYFKAIVAAQATGNLTQEGALARPMYPTMLLAYEFNDGYAFEFLGVTKDYERLTLVRRKVKSVDDVMGHFSAEESESAIEVGGSAVVGNFRFIAKRDMQVFKSRYPGMEDMHGTVINYSGDLPEGSAFHAIILKATSTYHRLDNVLAVNSYKGLVRMRYYQALVVVGRGQNALNLFKTFFPLEQNVPLGLLVPVKAESKHTQLNRAASFASLMTVKAPETTIGKFLERNEDILLSALNAKRIIPQPELLWIKQILGNDRTSIIPDFIFVDENDAAHLCDLKLPLLNRSSLTKSGRSRRRFVDSVAEGIAQLANYEEYFSYPENAEYALEQYGIRLSNPRKVLIVGSYENFDADKVSEANRERGDSAPEILDYDTVRNAYLINEGVL